MNVLSFVLHQSAGTVYSNHASGFRGRVGNEYPQGSSAAEIMLAAKVATLAEGRLPREARDPKEEQHGANEAKSPHSNLRSQRLSGS